MGGGGNCLLESMMTQGARHAVRARADGRWVGASAGGGSGTGRAATFRGSGSGSGSQALGRRGRRDRCAAKRVSEGWVEYRA